MSRKQFGDSAVGFSRSNGDDLRRALDWILKCGIFKDLSFHGNTKWQPVQLVALALLWVWSSKAALTDAFSENYKKDYRIRYIKSYDFVKTIYLSGTSNQKETLQKLRSLGYIN